MSGQGDTKAEQILATAVAEGPRDVLGLLGAVRADMEASFALHEGAVHALVYRMVLHGDLAPGGTSDRGLALYSTPDAPAPDANEPTADPAPVDAAIARAARKAASAIRDGGHRERVFSDVKAHLEELAASDGSHRFGRVRALQTLLQRIDRKNKPTVVVTAGAGDLLRRFVLHEGPWLLCAVVVFVVLKLFVVSPFKIPSLSMLPTLDKGDRVAVFTLFRDDVPDRWDVVVFKREDVHYVKRLIGLPGEELALWHGDVYIDGTLAVKPAHVTSALRSRVGRWTLDGKSVVGFAHQAAEGSRRWWWRSGRFEAHPRGSIVFGMHDGMAVLRGDRAASGELELHLAYGPSGTESDGLGWVLRVGPEGIVLREVTGSDLLAHPEEAVAVALAERKQPPAPGPVQLELAYVDGVLRARVDGWSYEAPRASPAGDLSVGVLQRGALGTPPTLTLDRDHHYGYAGSHGVPVHGERRGHAIPAGRVFFMGDNTTNSQDSRASAVGDIPLESIVGSVSVRIWPPSRWGLVR